MSEPPLGLAPSVQRPTWAVALLAALRIVLTLVVLTAAYFLLPTERADGSPDVWWLIVQLGIFGAVASLQLPAIIRSSHPVARAVEAVALSLPLFLIIFARIYLTTSLADPSAFNESLNRTAALYFSVTVFATVGFGDIVAESEGARLLVTLQMLLNLVVLGAGIRLLASAARRGVARRQSMAADEAASAAGDEESPTRSRSDRPDR